MADHGVAISNNTLSRKLNGEYPLNSDELAALASVIGVDPDVIWRDALRIMQETPAPAHDEIEAGLTPDGRHVVDQARAKRAKDTPPPRKVKRPRRSA